MLVRLSCALSLIFAVSGALAAEPEPALTPLEALARFQTAPGLRVELVAAEPLVTSPVALAFDERGRLFVAENRGYPTGPKEGAAPLGSIALLEDTNNDGQFDKRHEFATGLTYPNGVLPYDGGVIVTCAPDVLFLKDTNGDGRADERRVLLTGFSTGGSTQLRVSHPTLAQDGWVYVTSGLVGGTITAPGTDYPPLEVKRTDVRFRPDSRQYEAADGGAQFGLTFDDFSRRFICYNRVQVQHVVLSSSALRRNPHLAFAETVQNCPADTVAEPLKGHGAAAKLFPISANVTTADSHAGTFTAACGLLIYRGDALPAMYQGGAFSCDPTANLVHFDKLQQRGPTFAALRVHDNSEFLASVDTWFRPVYLASGPDGALYICDMTRKTIEHPDYLPVEIRKHTDFDSGRDLGRIWRVVRDDVSTETWQARRKATLQDAGVKDLVQALASDIGWTRDTAARLLREKRDAQAVPQLRSLLKRDLAPAARLAVLHAWQWQELIDDPSLRALLVHPAAPLREQALRWIEQRGVKVADLQDLLPLANDADPRVRFQLALTLAALPASEDAAREAQICTALAKIAVRDGEDRWSRAAIFSALAKRELPFFTALLTASAVDARLDHDLLLETGRLLGQSLPEASWPEVMQRLFATEGKPAFAIQAALLCGFGEALTERIKPADRAQWRKQLDNVLTAAQQVAQDDARPLSERQSALQLLQFSTFATTGALLVDFVDPRQPAELQAQAIRTLGRLRDVQVAKELLAPARYSAYSPGMREEVLGVVLAEPLYLSELLVALETEVLPPSALDAFRRRQLTQHREAAIRTRAEKLFGSIGGDRAQIYADLKSVVTLAAKASEGKKVFTRACASCHRLDREGFAVGPDLFGIRNQPKEAILLHVIVPDQEITAGFGAYTAILSDGRTLTGLIVAESPTTVTLRMPQGKEESLLRSEIEELVASKLSLMPQGLEQNITRQEFADLLAYLKGEQ